MHVQHGDTATRPVVGLCLRYQYCGYVRKLGLQFACVFSLRLQSSTTNVNCLLTVLLLISVCCGCLLFKW